MPAFCRGLGAPARYLGFPVAPTGCRAAVVRGAFVLFQSDGGPKLLDVTAKVPLLAPGHVGHHVGEPVGDSIELVLQRQVASRLAVLQ